MPAQFTLLKKMTLLRLQRVARLMEWGLTLEIATHGTRPPNTVNFIGSGTVVAQMGWSSVPCRVPLFA